MMCFITIAGGEGPNTTTKQIRAGQPIVTNHFLKTPAAGVLPAGNLAPDLMRRRLAGGLAALGAAALLPGCVSDRAIAARPHRIDVHHHILPPQYMAELKKLAPQETLQPWWTPAKSLEDMDKSGIETALVSLTQPQVWFGDAALARRLARESNEYAAGLARDYAGRFGFFATLPLPDIGGSLAAITHALDTLGADGIGLMTSYGNHYLGDAMFWPVYEELDRRGAVVYTHPLSPACCRNPLPQYLRDSSIELGTDTTRTMASLLFSGAAARFPRIRWIFSHAGGTMPFLISRFLREEAAHKERMKVLPQGLPETIKKFHYDTAQSTHRATLSSLLTLVPVSQVLFGTDYPARPGAEAVDGLAAYGFDPVQLAAIERGNALRLMPRRV
jgi:predicted TIM-barrel fold metal-dependent hydrolase